MKSVIALPDVIQGTTGAMVYWRLEGELEPAELRILWYQAGLDPAWLPSTPAPSTALARAMRGRTTRRRMLRSLEERGAHALVNETAKGDSLDYSVGLRVKLDVAGRPVFDPADHPLRPQIKADYEHHLEVCSSDDIGAWLVTAVTRCDGVAMRDRGGIYYVPPGQIALWDVMVSCMKRVSSHRTFKIPAMATGDAVEALIDAIEREATEEAAKLEAELLADELGERALQARVTRCEAMEAKVGRYEGLLGRKLDTLGQRLVALRGNLAAAALMVLDEV
jgi:hypothetical protein